MKEKAMELDHAEQSSQDKVKADSETNGAAGSGGAVAASHDAEETQKQDADESKAQTLSTEVEMTS